MHDLKISNSTKGNNQGQEISVLLVGNNPIEMGLLYDKLKMLEAQIKRVEIAFSKEDMLKKISLMHPNCLLIDDNIGLSPLKAIVKSVNEMSREAISITLLKSYNRQEAISGVQEYLMKEGIDGLKICNGLRNALRFKKTQQFFKIKYYSGQKRIRKIFR